MIIDSSAIVALLLEEPHAEEIDRVLVMHASKMSAATLVEVRAVIGGRLGPAGLRALDVLLRTYATEIVAFDPAQAGIASAGYQDFGRGSGHSAGLNLGDTFSYALAHATDEPLLHVGDDFAHTGIRSALAEFGGR